MISSRSSHEAFGDLLDAVDRLLAVPKPNGGGRPYVDVVADLLGYLARRMTELHEDRLAEVRSFLAWLEERLGCPIDDLSGKTFVRAYYEQTEGVDRLLDVIQRNHPARTSLDVGKPESYGARNPERDRLVEGYERSISALRPILLQIEMTDRLIDLLVYRLYGLSDEEIALVEAASGRTPGSVGPGGSTKAVNGRDGDASALD